MPFFFVLIRIYSIVLVAISCKYYIYGVVLAKRIEL